jgi:hypothetical protein
MDAEKYDQILEYISSNEDLKFLCDKRVLQEFVFPDLHQDEIVNLIDEMESIKPEVFKRLSKGMTSPIEANGLTKSFLKKGGFTKIKQDLLDEEQKLKERDDIEFEKTNVDLQLAKETLKEFPRTKWFARVGFIIAVVLAIKEILMLLEPLLTG